MGGRGALGANQVFSYPPWMCGLCAQHIREGDSDRPIVLLLNPPPPRTAGADEMVLDNVCMKMKNMRRTKDDHLPTD